MGGVRRTSFWVALAALVASGSVVQEISAAGPERSADAPEDATTRALAIVNGNPIKAEYATVMLRDRGVAASAPDKLQEEVAERLVASELFVQEAVRTGFDKNPDVKVRSEMLHRDVLANAYLQTYFRDHPITDEQLMADYEKRKAPFVGAREYSVRHILVADRTLAQELIKQLAAGADFAQLVDERSGDEGGSQNYGGSLGWISIENSDQALIDAVAGLEKGQIAREPVQTRFGWHVVRLDGIRDIRIQPFPAVKERLRQQLQQEQLATLERELRAKAAVVWPTKESTASVL
jgi:peptidyl-prolyl cis-trans isomerase C